LSTRYIASPFDTTEPAAGSHVTRPTLAATLAAPVDGDEVDCDEVDGDEVDGDEPPSDTVGAL